MNARLSTLLTAIVASVAMAGYLGLSSSALQTPPLPVQFETKAKPISGLKISLESREQAFRSTFNAGEEKQSQALDGLLPQWVLDNPQTAADFVKAMPAGLFRDKALRVVAHVWGEHDPVASRAWGQELNDTSDRDTFFTNICLGLIQKDPVAAIQMADQNQSREKGLLENLVQQWAEKDIPASLAWAAQQPGGEERDELLQRIVLVQSRTNPAQAAALVVQQISPGAIQIEAAMSVVHQWAERDWNGAVSWVNEFPDGPLRDRAITELNGMAR